MLCHYFRVTQSIPAEANVEELYDIFTIFQLALDINVDLIRLKIQFWVWIKDNFELRLSKSTGRSFLHGFAFKI